MANLMDMLQSQLTDSMIDQLSKNIGGADRNATKTAASGILSTIISGLAKNAAKPGGAESLAGALDRDHDGSLLDKMSDLLGAANSSSPATAPSGLESALNGAGILKHILGGKQSGAVDIISKMSGLQSGQAGNLMEMLAPMVMGTLGRQKKQNNLNPTDLTDLLSGTVKSASNQRQEMGLIGKFLDQDGDGSIMDDLAGMGLKMFGNMFKK